MSVTSKVAGGGQGRSLVYLAIGALVMAVALMTATLAYLAYKSQHDREYIELLGEQSVLSQTIAKYAADAAGGEVVSFAPLRRARTTFEANMNLLRHGNPASGLPALREQDGEVNEALVALERRWNEYRTNIDTVLEREQVIDALREHVQAIRDAVPHLLAQSDVTVVQLAQSGAPREQIYLAGRQLMLLQRIENRVGDVLAGGDDAVSAADRFARDAALFEQVVNGMLNGNPRLGLVRVSDEQTRTTLRQVADSFAGVRERVGAIMERSPESFEVVAAAQRALAISDEILVDLGAMAESLHAQSELRGLGYYGAVLFGLIGLLMLVGIGWLLRRDAQVRLEETAARNRLAEEENARNQEAILRLLDEMGDLADGDLTVSATVNEDITGAIADSINYAIETLRNLVAAINDTTQQVSGAAQRTQKTAQELAEASEHQSERVTSATAAITQMASSIEEVSENATQLAGEAESSVQIATKGAGAVQATSRGMDTIREQIQETSKRIKRLGESSQEIGDIVELINDIAEQTNILALNAAIQAAMAGDAGRGFAVVADEVQRLAERSTGATKQIEALVKTIQADTNEAIISMEESTAGVVSGANLAQDAGRALEEIEAVSRRLASLIANISSSANQQASAAAAVSDTMNVIQEITSQTTAGAKESSAAIGNLAGLADELRRSVAGFKLPAA
ncbi:type IV pili methyl-accepting chemotaxis transducer N-terminal domain-containing protein [Ectothiorhodospiraceae bacterium 2226]|nr:type IV pili methyl-accepting chemotaxis transducer N-terminal domain-containing protein [Ectothiorhodospiraceae bacterium 2226]